MRIRDALQTQMRVLVAVGLTCAIWLVVYFGAFSHATRERFKEAVAPLNTDSGVWVGALIQAVFSVLTPVVLGTDDDLPGHGCGVSCLCATKDATKDLSKEQEHESAVELAGLEACLDDEDKNKTNSQPCAPPEKRGLEEMKPRTPSCTSVTLFLLWKTATFTVILAVLTYYVRWFYALQDKYFGAVHDEETGVLKWDVLFKKIIVDEYVFTPTNVPPVVTLFLFTRLIGRQLFLEWEGAGKPEEQGDCKEDKTAVCGSDGILVNGKAGGAVTYSMIAFDWLVWVIPHYILCLMTWFPSHLMIYPMPSGVQLPLFMCVVILSNVLQSYMTMNSAGGRNKEGNQEGNQEVKPEKFPEWASAKAKRWFGRR
jgi:hypothetical protein